MGGSRSEPSGMVYAPMNMARPPWDTFTDKAISCPSDEFQRDLGIHTSYSCLSHTIIGNSKQYRWFPHVNVAVWRASDSHCYICKLAGDSSSWNFSDSKGDISYALEQGKQTVFVERDDSENDDDDETDDDEASERKVMERIQRHVEKTQRLEANEEVDAPNSRAGTSAPIGPGSSSQNFCRALVTSVLTLRTTRCSMASRPIASPAAMTRQKLGSIAGKHRALRAASRVLSSKTLRQ